MCQDTFNIKGIEFEVEFELDVEHPSGDLWVMIESIAIDGVDVTEIIADAWVNLIQHQIYERSIRSRYDRAAFFA